MDVIKRIEELRHARKWTKYELAEEAMLTYSTLASMYERNTPPKIDMLQSLCDAFEISLAQFFAQDESSVFVSEDERELIDLYRALSVNKRQALLSLIKKED